MHNLIIVLGVTATIGLLIFAYSLYIKFSQKTNSKNKTNPTKNLPPNNASLATCPLCKSPLAKGENLSSKVFRPIQEKYDSEQRCTILGCPHCLPYCQNGVQRHCPVCKKKVPAEGYLIARLITHTNGKKHVRITGCTECHKKV
ncbi:MAG: hypothetical protein J6B81_04810 [Spirochaetaceae bacterium]|nr:hypothetical protein [Spirochaetaceae bacterium]